MKARVVAANVIANCLISICLAAPLTAAGAAYAADVKVLSAGAFKQIVLAMQPAFEKQTGHRLIVDNDTVGALMKRIEGGEAFDVAVLSPGAVDELIAKGKAAPGSRINLARVGIGVMVKDGAPKPDVSTVEAFKQAVLAAKTVAFIDPASGGSSGIYLVKLFDQMGIGDQVKAKAKLKQGGYVADLIVSGVAELGIHQISEIVPAKGVTLVAPLPKEIQNYTVYAAGLSATTTQGDAAKALIKVLSGPPAADLLRAKGMEPAGAP
jgi:molybdate transport system substrate-binding protein